MGPGAGRPRWSLLAVSWRHQRQLDAGRAGRGRRLRHRDGVDEPVLLPGDRSASIWARASSSSSSGRSPSPPRSPARARNTVALVLAVVGVRRAVRASRSTASRSGLLFILGASVMWAAYIVVGRTGRRSSIAASPASASGWCIGAIVIAPFGVAGSGPVWTLGDLLLLCLLVGVLSNAVGYGIDQHVLRRIPVRRFALLLALLPVTAMVVGFIALDQRPIVARPAGRRAGHRRRRGPRTRRARRRRARDRPGLTPVISACRRDRTVESAQWVRPGAQRPSSSWMMMRSRLA